MSEPVESQPRPTPDRLLHTGGERSVDPIDLVMARGMDPTPERIERARQALEKYGAAAVERVLP
jgi:hypothetical protein